MNLPQITKKHYMQLFTALHWVELCRFSPTQSLQLGGSWLKSYSLLAVGTWADTRSLQAAGDILLADTWVRFQTRRGTSRGLCSDLGDRHASASHTQRAIFPNQ